MAFLSDDNTPISPQRIILMGDSGMGKTGSLLSLAEAGYTLHIADCECKAASLFKAIASDAVASGKWKREKVRDIFSRIEIEEIAEPLSEKAKKELDRIYGIKDPEKRQAEIEKYEVSTAAIPEGKAFGNFGKLMGRWGMQYTSDKDILVVDSLTRLAEYAAKVEAKKQAKPFIDFNNYNAVYNALRTSVRDTLISWDSSLAGQGYQIDCHLIFLAHVQYYSIKHKVDGAIIKSGGKEAMGSGDSEVVDTKLFPKTIGDKFSQDVPAWFNVLLKYDTATNQPGKRIIRLLADADAPVKLAAPSFAESKKSLPIETGLADIFKVLTQEI